MCKSRDVSRNGGLSLGAFVIFILLACSTAFAQPYVYERSFGTYGEGPGQFQQITAIDQDSQGNYVILDGYVGEFQICSNVGVCTVHDTAAKAAEEHGSQWGLAVNSMDEIFITNQIGKVEKCTPDGQCSVIITEYNDEPIYPTGIAIDSHDRVFIADANYARILVCDSNGSCSSFGTWGTELGEFSSPYGLVINPAGQVLVSDAGNYRMQACDYQGNCEYAGYDNSNYYYYGGYGQGITMLPSGTMITTGYGYSHVNACTPKGACRLVSQYDYYHTNYLQNPVGITVNEEGRLVIGDYGAVHFLRPNVTINAGINDAWIEQGIPAQGLLVSVFEEIPLVFIAWFTYDATRPDGMQDPAIGEWGHRWVTLQGGFTGNVANLDMYLTQGGVFEAASPAPPPADRIGSATLTVHDCYNATLVYQIDGTNFQRTKHLVRIVHNNVPTCEILSGGIWGAD